MPESYQKGEGAPETFLRWRLFGSLRNNIAPHLKRYFTLVGKFRNLTIGRGGFSCQGNVTDGWNRLITMYLVISERNVVVESAEYPQTISNKLHSQWNFNFSVKSQEYYFIFIIASLLSENYVQHELLRRFLTDTPLTGRRNQDGRISCWYEEHFLSCTNPSSNSKTRACG